MEDGPRDMSLQDMMLFSKLASFNPQDYINVLKTKQAEAQLRLAREKDKPYPDVLKLDKCEKEVKLWETALQKLESSMAEYVEPEKKLKGELAQFFDLLMVKKVLKQSEAEAKITFKDNIWKSIFFALVKKDKRVRTKREFFLFGQHVYEWV